MVNFNGRTDSKETHDAESLRRIVTTIRNLLAPAIRLAGDPDDPRSSGAMQAGNVKKLEIYYFQSMERAMKELTRWGGACESAWNKLLIEQGSSAMAKPVAKHVVAAKPGKEMAKKKKKR
jgi:hypothetical protein